MNPRKKNTKTGLIEYDDIGEDMYFLPGHIEPLKVIIYVVTKKENRSLNLTVTFHELIDYSVYFSSY